MYMGENGQGERGYIEKKEKNQSTRSTAPVNNLELSYLGVKIWNLIIS